MVLTVCVVWGIDTFNVLPAYLQDIVNRSLPILIVFFGLWHLLRRRLPMGTLIAFVLSVILLAGVIFQAFSLRAERYFRGATSAHPIQHQPCHPFGARALTNAQHRC
jgi:carbon starvation protein CstA